MKVILMRQLNDYDSWKERMAEFKDKRAEFGSKGVEIYRSVRDPNEVHLVFDWDDDKPFVDYFENPEVKKALDDSGTTEMVEISESFHIDS
jgi:heme-degrading monooxygenase HmoA